MTLHKFSLPAFFGELQGNGSVLNWKLLASRLGLILVYFTRASLEGKKLYWGFSFGWCSFLCLVRENKILCLVFHGMSFWPIFNLFVLWLNKGSHYGLFAVCRENSVSLCKLLWVTYFMINKQTMVQCFQELISVHSCITSVHFSVCWVHCGSAEMCVCSHRNASAITFWKTCLSICLLLWPDGPTVIPQKSHYSSRSSLLYCFQRWSKRLAKIGWTNMSSLLVCCQPYSPPYTPEFYGNLSLSSFPLSLPFIFKCNTTTWNLDVITVFVQGQ